MQTFLAAVPALAPVLAGVAGLVVAVRYGLGRVLPPAVRAWVEAAAYFALAAAAVYAWGVWHLVAWEVVDSCAPARAAALVQRIRPEYFFPLQRCTPEEHLVPGYVNPLIVVFLVAAVSCAGTAVAIACHCLRARSSR